MDAARLEAHISAAIAGLHFPVTVGKAKIRKPRIAVMCSSVDKREARAIWKGITAHPDKADAWLADENLLPGQDWALEIDKVLEGYDFIIIALSGKSVTREGYLQKEIRQAIEAKDTRDDRANKIVAIMLGDFEIPRSLRDQSPFKADENLGANVCARIQDGYAFHIGLPVK